MLFVIETLGSTFWIQIYGFVVVCKRNDIQSFPSPFSSFISPGLWKPKVRRIKIASTGIEMKDFIGTITATLIESSRKFHASLLEANIYVHKFSAKNWQWFLVLSMLFCNFLYFSFFILQLFQHSTFFRLVFATIKLWLKQRFSFSCSVKHRDWTSDHSTLESPKLYWGNETLWGVENIIRSKKKSAVQL